MPKTTRPAQFVSLFRTAAPYIKAFRGRRFVVYITGDAIASKDFTHLLQDVALLHSLGIRIVLVHGARTQISRQLAERGVLNGIQDSNDIRVTSDTDMATVKQQIGIIRLDIEAQLSIGLANISLDQARIRVVSGNFISAKPYGVRNGIDYQYTGEVRRIHSNAIQDHLDQHAIVLLSPIGFSLSGEAFNLRAEDVAFETAKALKADKLLCLLEKDYLIDGKGELIRELSCHEVEKFVTKAANLDQHSLSLLQAAVSCCDNQVNRVHLLNRHLDGALLQELFTSDGIGSLISATPIEGTRNAESTDIASILELIQPLENEGILLRRSREKLETDIGQFTVVERDGRIIACAALAILPETGMAELACLAVHPDYRQSGRGDALLRHMESLAKRKAVDKLFVLSTRTSQWFSERGFDEVNVSELPASKQSLYNYQRNSKVFRKRLGK